MASEEKSENSLSLSALIEGLLFVAPGGIAPSHLASALGVSVREVEAGLAELDEFYQVRALRLQNYRGRYQITTAPATASLIEKFLELESSFRMTRAALETLAIVAYQQPVTKPHIDSIRGVNSDSVLRNLLSKGLVMEAGRDEGPGRPIFYITSAEFLQHFGLNRLEDLPALELAPEPTENAEEAETGNGQEDPTRTDNKTSSSPPPVRDIEAQNGHPEEVASGKEMAGDIGSDEPSPENTADHAEPDAPPDPDANPS